MQAAFYTMEKISRHMVSCDSMAKLSSYLMETLSSARTM